MSAEDVRKLHSKFGVYNECEHNTDEDGPEFHDGKTTVCVDAFGYTCSEAAYFICSECDTDDGEMDEYSMDGKWPCDTLIELEKP